MAQKVTVQHVDDLNGLTSDEAPIETLEFGLDGATYEIDLTDTNAKGLREAYAAYIAAGRRRGGRITRRRPTTTRQPLAIPQRPTQSAAPTGQGPAKRDPAQTKAIREWAQKTGRTISARGRIPAAVERDYHAAH